MSITSLKSYNCSLTPEKAANGLEATQRVFSSTKLPEHYFVLAVKDCYSMLTADLTQLQIGSLVNLGYIAKAYEFFNSIAYKETANEVRIPKTPNNNVSEYLIKEIGYWLWCSKIYFPKVAFEKTPEGESKKNLYRAIVKSAKSRFNPKEFELYQHESRIGLEGSFRLLKLMTRYLILCDMRASEFGDVYNPRLVAKIQKCHSTKKENENYDFIGEVINILKKMNKSLEAEIADNSIATATLLDDKEHTLTIELADYLISLFDR